MNTEKSKCHRLYWIDNESNRRHPAGVAFFNEPQGDYRLKVDLFPEDKIIYLKPISTTNGIINFRVEAAVKKQGVVAHRAEVGFGHASIETGYPVYIHLGPYNRTLMMEAA